MLGAVAETWWQYVERVSNSASQRAIADAIGVDKTTVWRWKNNPSGTDPSTAIKVARTYNRPITEALLAAGAIEPGEAAFTEVVVKGTPADLTDDEILAEIRRRMKR